MKKLLWIIGGLFFAFLVAIVSIPLFVDVDQYRPTIMAEANKKINGNLELGKLKLSLWGAIKIHADSIKLSVNGFPEPMLNTQQFHVELPLMSLLSGAPQVIAVLDSPKISVIRELNGKMNALELMKVPGASTEALPSAPAPEKTAGVDSISAVSAAAGKASPPKGTSEPAANGGASPTPPPAAVPVSPAADRIAAAPAPSKSTKVPAIIAGASIGLRIQNGDVAYLDKVAKSSYQVVGLDLNARNIGLGSTMNVTLKAPVKGSSPSMTFEGPITLDTELKPLLVESVVKSVSGRLQLDATKLSVEMKGGTFHKTASMPLTLNAVFDGSEKETLLRGLDLDFDGFKFHGKGRVTMEPQTAKLEISTDPGTVRLDKLHTFVPMVEQYQLKGLTDFTAKIDWTPATMKVDGDVKVSEGGFFLKDVLKAPMQFRLAAGFSEDLLNISRASLSGVETDVELVGSIKKFLAPQFSFAITGKSFNVDKTLNLAPPPTKSTALFQLIPEAQAAAPDVNPMLDLAKNPIVANASGLITAQIGKITAYNSVMEQVQAKVQLEKMMLKILDASLKTFGGSVKTAGEFDLKSPGLTFHSTGNVTNIVAKEGMKAYVPKYQNTLEGIVDASWNFSGPAFPASTRIHNLKGTAKITARDGAVKSVDFQDAIGSATAKIPFMKGKKVNVDNGFKTLAADVKMENGVVRAEPIEIYPRNQGLVIKGKSTIQENLDQETYFDIFDPQNQLPKEFKVAAGKPAIQLHINGQLSKPNVDYPYTLQRIAQTAGVNVLKEQGLKLLGVEDKPGMSDQDKLKKAAEELKKKFHF